MSLYHVVGLSLLKLFCNYCPQVWGNISPKFGDVLSPLVNYCSQFLGIDNIPKNGDKKSKKNGTNNPQSWGQKFPKGDNKSPNLGTIIAQT